MEGDEREGESVDTGVAALIREAYDPRVPRERENEEEREYEREKGRTTTLVYPWKRERSQSAPKTRTSFSSTFLVPLR